MKAYLAGKILKGDEIGKRKDWREEYDNILSSIGIGILSPHDPSLDESDVMQIFGHDCFLVKKADMIIVNATEKLGAGTAQEMVIAKLYAKFVISVVPIDSHYHRRNLVMECGIIENWLHPFISSFSDLIVNSPSDLALKLKDINMSDMRVKTISIVEDAIDYYIKRRDNFGK